MKTLLITAFLSVMCLIGVAQGFRGRVILGLNGSQVDGDQRTGWHRFGLVAGFGAEFPVNPKFSVEPEFLYSAKGSITSDKELDAGMAPFQFAFRYVELPVQFNYYMRKDLRFRLGLIPQYLLSAKADAGTGIGYEDYYDRLNKIDIMGSAGLEYLLSDRFAAGMQYNYSMIPINKGGADFSIIGLRGGMYNNVLSFTIHYILIGPNEDGASE
ncbi:MAG: porin family protein [Bacteroidota bacterium]